MPIIDVYIKKNKTEISKEDKKKMDNPLYSVVFID